MYTLPGKTRITIRRPGKPLVGLVETVLRRTRQAAFKRDRLYVEVTDYVVGEYDPWHRCVFAWYSFETGEARPIYETSREFEIEPAYALFMSRGGDVSIFFNTLSVDPEATVAMDVARDAILEGRIDVATRILRAAIPHAYLLYLALVQKEKNLT
jgi:hypothetical protein